MNNSRASGEAPTSAARRWVTYVIGFGVSAVVGVAPFLGIFDVPGFHALLTLFPKVPFDMTTVVIVASSLLMGIVAVVIQYLIYRKPRSFFVRRLFVLFSAIAIVSILSLLVVHTFTVVVVNIPAEGPDAEIAVLVGFSRSACSRECDPQMSNPECIRNTTLDPVRIYSCWGEVSIRMAFLALMMLYLIVTSSFGAMIGGLILARPPSDKVTE